MADPQKEAPESLWPALISAIILFVVDALFLNQGGIAFIVGGWVMFISLPGTFLGKKYRSGRGRRLKQLGIYMAAVVLVLAANEVNNRIAQSRAETLVAAIKAYHAEHQAYPRTLEVLVPEILPSIPLAKYTFRTNTFGYLYQPESPALFYVALPPFGRPTYFFKDDEWTYVD